MGFCKREEGRPGGKKSLNKDLKVRGFMTFEESREELP